MIADLADLEPGTRLHADLCVIGAGIAGITLALELERFGIDCIVLESGGLVREADTSTLSDGENRGLPFLFDDGTRSRWLGGSSNCWGGWCRPFDAIDFQARDWVPHSGWPIGLDTLEPWYRRAHRVLELGPTHFDPDRWVSASGNPRLRRLQFPGGQVEDQVFQFSPPTRFGTRYRERLERAQHVRVLLHANVVDILTDENARTVDSLKVRSLDGRTATVAARQVVLAAGGIENVRLLLNARSRRPAGLGNDHDQVGRHFMDHPRLCAGRVRFAKGVPHPALYDQLYHALNPATSAFGTGFGGHFVLSPDAQARERVLNAQTWFRSFAPGERSPSSTALMRLKLRSLGGACGDSSMLGDVARLLRNPMSAGAFALTRKLHITRLIREVRFNTIVEPAPDPDSRITLADDVDALGLRRASIDWRLGALVRRTFDRTWSLIAGALHDAGLARVDLPEPIEHTEWRVPDSLSYYVWGHGKMIDQGDTWPRLPDWTWHHMGGTRMHASPRHGVVDAHLRVHGMSNLWVGGSSVFPTGGANFPTMTIVALSLRLAERLASEVGRRVPAQAAGFDASWGEADPQGRGQVDLAGARKAFG